MEERTYRMARAFGVEPKSIERYGFGHINETYLVTAEDGAQYILQLINPRVFSDIGKLMSNVFKVTEYAARDMESRGIDSTRRVLHFLKAGDREYIPEENGGWRCYRYVGDATAYQRVEKPEHFFEAGRAFGAFQKTLAHFPASELYDTIPDFHNTVKRVEAFRRAVDGAPEDRRARAAEDIAFALERTKYANVVVDKLASGELPLKVTHNDTKFNNILIDDATDKGICVIDLDTIMAGSSLYDFGDAIRFGCNPAAEDEKDLSKVNFSMPLFREFAKGYVGELGDSLVKAERDLLAFSAVLMTYECGIRFLGDYLAGDVYFRISRPEQNLDRCRTQFKLVSDMEKVLPEMQAFIDSL